MNYILHIIYIIHAYVYEKKKKTNAYELSLDSFFFLYSLCFLLHEIGNTIYFFKSKIQQCKYVVETQKMFFLDG